MSVKFLLCWSHREPVFYAGIGTCIAKRGDWSRVVANTR